MMRKAVLSRLLVDPWLAWLLAMSLLALIIVTTMQYRTIEREAAQNLGESGSFFASDLETGNAPDPNDYKHLHIVGQLSRKAKLVAADDTGHLTSAQQTFTGATTFMPWTNSSLLPLAGLAWSYMLFMVATLMLFLWTLSRLNVELAGAAILAVYPSLALIVRLGHNGMLTGSLIGLFLVGLSRQRSSAGVPLGLMVIKPHLAISMGLVALLQQRWRVVAIAAVVIVLSCAAATIVLEPEVWPAFLPRDAAAGAYPREDLFFLYHMSSISAGMGIFKAPPSTAMAVHLCGALVALGLVILAWRRGLQSNRLLALACFTTVFISPYDYDLAFLAIAAALVLPELLARAQSAEIVLFYILAWVGTGARPAQYFGAELFAGTTQNPHDSPLVWSLQAIGLLGTAALTAMILRRPQRMAIVPDTRGGSGPRVVS